MSVPAFDGTDQCHAALWLIGREFHVFPADNPELETCAGIGSGHYRNTCTDRGKHPAVPWGKWAPRFGRDAQEISRRFAGDARNVAVACKPSGLLVIDEDERGAFTRFAETAGHTIPATFTVETGRGRHYYFRNPADLGNTSEELKRWHIDVRGAGGQYGGYVIAPGSLHASGAIYTPVDPGAEVADCPGWLAEVIAGPPASAPAADLDHPAFSQPSARDYQHDPIPYRMRHDALVKYASRLRKTGLDYAEAVPVFRERWLNCVQPPGHVDGARFQDPNVPYPVTWEEAQAKLADVFDRYRAGQDLSRADDGQQDAPQVRRVRSQPISVITRRRRQYLWENRLPLGEVTLWVGHAGIGKSQAAVWLSAQVSRGELPGELYGTPSPVLYLGTEDSWEYTLAPRFDAAGADPAMVHRLYAETEEGSEATVSLSVDLESLREEILATGARLIVLDALLSTFGSAKLTEQGTVRRHLEPLARLAQELNVAVVGVAHFRKASDANPLHMISGSAEFGQVVRSAIGFAPDREADDGSCVLSLVKTNIAPADLPSIRYRIEPGVVVTEEGPTDVGRFTILGETDRNVGDLLNQEGGSTEDRTERTEAAEWLLSYLADCGGEAIAGEVIKAGEAAGFAKHTIQRARKKAGVRSQKSGLKGGWAWALTPAEDDTRTREDDTKMTKVTAHGTLSSSSSSVSPSTAEHPAGFADCSVCGRRTNLDLWPNGRCADHQDQKEGAA